MKNIDSQKDSWLLEIETEKKFKKYIVKKGSIAIDGTSLTISKVLENKIEIVYIPFTIENTIAQFYKVGDKVNFEVDLMAKYSEKLLKVNKNDSIPKQNTVISSQWLNEQGWS